MGIATKIMPLCDSQAEIWAKAVPIGGHFEIQDGRQSPNVTKCPNFIIIVLIGFPDPENMGIDTKIKPLCDSQAAI
jgi:hypothetical protein